MAYLPKPSKPLNILTIDGGGLQAIASLLILGKLLKTVANVSEDDNLRPCDVFDVIIGYGTGGWVALLLERFQMSVSAAWEVWERLVTKITSKTRAEKLHVDLMKDSFYDVECLVEFVDQLARDELSTEYMYMKPQQDIRCRHVFVSALKADSKSDDLAYSLYRTYDCPEDARLLDGPSNPRKYNISHAFAATGATKYLTSAWEEVRADKSKSKYLDTQFPRPHNITGLALDEVWGLYGRNVQIAVAINVGPGIPNEPDCRDHARSMLWSIPTPLPVRQTTARAHASDRNVADEYYYTIAHDRSGSFSAQRQKRRAHEKLLEEQYSPNAKHPEKPTFEEYAERGGLGVGKHKLTLEEKLRREETCLENKVKRRLWDSHKHKTPPFFRFVPDRSTLGSTMNDTTNNKIEERVIKDTEQYLSLGPVGRHMEEVAGLLLKNDTEAYEVAEH